MKSFIGLVDPPLAISNKSPSLTHFQLCGISKGIYFDIYGSYLHDYQGDREIKEQYKLWDIKEDGGKEHD